jgi:hypothetical protein
MVCAKHDGKHRIKRRIRCVVWLGHFLSMNVPAIEEDYNLFVCFFWGDLQDSHTNPYITQQGKPYQKKHN